MLSDDLLLKVLKLYFRTRVVTRPEVGLMTGSTVGRIAGLCHRNNIQQWPPVPLAVKLKRTCCFLMTLPDDTTPKLCCRPVAPGNTLLCDEHLGKTWTPKSVL